MGEISDDDRLLIVTGKSNSDRGREIEMQNRISDHRIHELAMNYSVRDFPAGMRYAVRLNGSMVAAVDVVAFARAILREAACH